MRRALVAFLFALPLLLVACSDSSDDSSTGVKPPYAGSPGAPPPTAPARKALTQADIDKFVNLSFDFATNPKTPEGQKTVLEKHGVSQTEWGDLWARVNETKKALIRLEKRGEAVPANLAADVEIYKTNREMLGKAETGKR